MRSTPSVNSGSTKRKTTRLSAQNQPWDETSLRQGYGSASELVPPDLIQANRIVFAPAPQ
jgi:hypothetical protein